MELSLISCKNLPNKAAEVLLRRAKEAGFTSIGELYYDELPAGPQPNGQSVEFIHRFTAEAIK